MGKKCSVTFYARWADMDFNGHMKNTAYLDYAADSRMIYFREHGFSMSDFKKLGFGPVVFTDTVSYRRELFMYQEFSVELTLGGMSEDGSRFCLINEFRGTDGTLIASLRSDGGWLNLASRKITSPPEDLLRIMRALEKTDTHEGIEVLKHEVA